MNCIGVHGPSPSREEEQHAFLPISIFALVLVIEMSENSNPKGIHSLIK